MKGKAIQQNRFSHSGNFLSKNEPIRGSIMTNKVLAFIDHLNSSLNEEFSFYSMTDLSCLSLVSLKSNLLLKFKAVEKEGNKIYLLLVAKICKDKKGGRDFEAIGSLIKESPISVKDIVSVLENS